MAVDLTSVPWNRLAKLAPPGSTLDDLQAAADRWALRADVYNAAADLWEELALTVDVATQDTQPDTTGSVASVSQDGISVTYANDPLAGNGLSARVASRGQMLATARKLRARGRPKSVLMHEPEYDAWTGKTGLESQIIVVDEV
jgi:hypothetical protein